MSASKPEGAVKLREAGLSYLEIARYLGVGKATVYRWINPDYAEQSREASRAWKASNRDRTREYDQAHAHKPCPNCGGEMSRQREMCAGCHAVVADVRRSLAEGMWADGWLLREINEVLGWKMPGGVTVMRRCGWDLPYRYRVKGRLAA